MSSGLDFFKPVQSEIVHRTKTSLFNECKVLKLLYSNKTIKYIQLISLNDLTTLFNHYLLTLLLYEHSAILNVFH